MHRIGLAITVLTLIPLSQAVAQGRRGPDKAPAKGKKAPDFDLYQLNKDGTQSKKKVKLSEVCKKRPVALIFGSYT